MATGSTMMSSAPLLAVERASPQWLNAEAPAKPKMPIHTMRQASPRPTGRPAGSIHRANGIRTAAPITRRAKASKDGGTVSSVRRVAA